MMGVTLIGTGALQPLPRRALASAALTLAGRHLLLDCGEGTQSAARAAGVSLMKIDIIALTHYHGDHTFGLPGLLQTMGMAGRCEPVTIFGPACPEEELAPFVTLCAGLPFELRLRTLPPEGLSLHSVSPAWPEQARLTAFPTEHRVPSQGYRLELMRSGKFQPQQAKALGVPVTAWKQLQRGEAVQVGERLVLPQQVLSAPRRGLSVVYSGDTSPCDALLAASREADLLICEATYGEDEMAQRALEHGHMTFAQAAHIAAQAQARALWLTHYSPMIDDAQSYLPFAASIFPAACCGLDGMQTLLHFDASPI